MNRQGRVEETGPRKRKRQRQKGARERTGLDEDLIDRRLCLFGASDQARSNVWAVCACAWDGSTIIMGGTLGPTTNTTNKGPVQRRCIQSSSLIPPSRPMSGRDHFLGQGQVAPDLGLSALTPMANPSSDEACRMYTAKCRMHDQPARLEKRWCAAVRCK